MVTKVADLRPNKLPIDPDVKVPDAVRRASEAADAAMLGAYPPPIVPADQVPPVTPSGNEPPPATEPQLEAPPPPPPAPEDPATVEHRLRSELGREKAKTGRLEAALSAATDRLTALENMVHELRSAPPAAAPAPAAPPTRLVSEKEEDEFGTEMLDVMGRRAREIVSPELAELRAAMQTIEQKLSGTTVAIQRNARAEMFAGLDAGVPNWRQVNDLTEFKAWLALPDPYSGDTRHSMLLSAFEKNDTSRVLNFFKGFVSELAATTPALSTPGATAPAPEPERLTLEDLAAPGRARTPAQQLAPAEKQIITTADIDAFYSAKAKGQYAGREAEFAALEQELFKAQREGRVRAV